jgi:hypothetical protein
MKAQDKVYHSWVDTDGVRHLTLNGTPLKMVKIRGDETRISLVYFYMMCASERHIKPDHMVVRFLERALGRRVHNREVAQLLTGAAFLLHDLYPHITPRVLDNLIWQYESERSR